MRGQVVAIADLLVDGTGAAPVPRPAVTVSDGRIVAVESRPADWRAPAGFDLIDASGWTLLPGLIDSHVHLAFPELDASAADLAALGSGATERAHAALAGGVTTVRDLGSADGIAIRLRDEIAAGRVAGPRIVAAGKPLTTTGGHCHWFSHIADTGADLIAAVDAAAREGADVIKVMATGGMATPGSDPWTPQYSVEELAPAVEHAHRLGLRVAAHALCTAGLRVAIAAGVDTLEHGWTITGARQDFQPGVAVLAARSGVFGSVTTHDALRNLLSDRDGQGGDVAEIRRRLEPHRALAAAGVPMVVHSDAGPGPTRFDDFTASVRVFAVGMDVDAVGAIHAATGIPAAALGRADDIGTVQPGRLADVIAVEGDATVDLPTRDGVRLVIQGGRVVARDGRLVSPTSLP